MRTTSYVLAMIACMGGTLSGQIPTFVTRPQLTLGDSTGGPTMIFDRLSDARRLSDGRIIVADCGVKQVRGYDSSGKYFSTLAFAPQPQRGLTRLFVAGGDTLGAYENINTRLSLVTPTLTVARVIPLPDPAPPRPDGRPSINSLDVIGRFADGSFVGRLVANATTEVGVQRRNVSFYHFSAAGEMIDSLVGIPGPETMVVAGQAGGAVRLGRVTVVAVFPDRLVIGDQATAELVEYGMNLKVIRRIPTITKPVPVTDSIRAAWTAMMIARTNFPVNGISPVYKDVYAEALPAFRDLVAGVDGRIWVQDPGGADSYPLIWTAYDNARPAARVELPPRFYPTQFGPDWVLGLAFDSTKVALPRVAPAAVEHVQLLRFTAGALSDRRLSPHDAAPTNRPLCGAGFSR